MSVNIAFQSYEKIANPLPPQILIRHGADAGVGPDVFGGFEHVDDRIDRQDEAHDFDGGAEACHEGNGQEEAAHGHAGVADGRDDGDEHPQQHGADAEGEAAVLHHEQRAHQDEGGAAVHVDGGADGEDEAGDFRVHAQAVLGRGERDGQRCGGALREEGHHHGGTHRAEDFQRVDLPGQEEQRQDDEELDGVAGEDHRRVLAQRAQDEAGAELAGELGRESGDAERERPDERLDEREEELLQPLDSLDYHALTLRIGHPGEGQADGDGDQEDGQDIPRQEGLDDIVRDDRDDVVIEGRSPGRHFRGRREEFLREVLGGDQKVQAHAHERGHEGGQEGVRDGMGKDLPGAPLLAEGDEGGRDGEGHGGDGEELEEPRVHRREELAHGVHGLHVQEAEDRAQDERAEPPEELFVAGFHGSMVKFAPECTKKWAETEICCYLCMIQNTEDLKNHTYETDSYPGGRRLAGGLLLPEESAEDSGAVLFPDEHDEGRRRRDCQRPRRGPRGHPPRRPLRRRHSGRRRPLREGCRRRQTS